MITDITKLSIIKLKQRENELFLEKCMHRHSIFLYITIYYNLQGVKKQNISYNILSMHAVKK